LRDLELEFEITLKLEANAELPAGHPISLHGARPTESGDAAPETVTDVDAPEAESEEGEDGGRRRRRRRRR
ncbi:MAG: hypothetical protein GWO16_09305, partial [Gammaproteobacteria bacterium]|nr:hypothetical protein [Gammaproteobacteria bacterium]NIR96880.1 hypothetical protein [Gammaproteobacteria bacterium]NIT64289.1 hypothetical protein [Gammaproteobacteria bacterium]NIV19535.1 hypothetical protein [Gammaproteobacteria bacterium]NIY32869.1 hypothetical protein [Gammaproteobacteria bacterium]